MLSRSGPCHPGSWTNLEYKKKGPDPSIETLQNSNGYPRGKWNEERYLPGSLNFARISGSHSYQQFYLTLSNQRGVRSTVPDHRFAGEPTQRPSLSVSPPNGQQDMGAPSESKEFWEKHNNM